jgi:hypothetical protein
MSLRDIFSLEVAPFVRTGSLVERQLPRDYITDLAMALAVLGERDLHGLRAAIEGSPDFVPGLLAWLEHAVGWEINRRATLMYPLLDPHAAIDDPEIDQSLVALAVLAACFRDTSLPM